MYGAQLIKAMRRIDPPVEFFGVGGEKMRAVGCEVVVDSKDLAVVGITEILSHLPKIWRLFNKLIAEADRRKPDLAIVIDSPAFNWRVARQMKKRGIPVVYYVCPQFWAWRQGRVRLLRKYIDKALVIFPFEEKFYRDRGVNAEFVGHPLAELPRPAISHEEYAANHALNPAKQWITLMPGSRVKEVRMNLPAMLAASRRLGAEYEFLLPVAPTLDAEFMQTLVGQAPFRKGTAFSRNDDRSKLTDGITGSRALPDSNGRVLPQSSNRSDLPVIHLVPDALPALAHSRAGIIASGTATVEAALMDLPFVMVYRVTPLTYLLGRSTVKVPHFAMVNLIAGRQVVPELVQKDFTPEKVTAEMNKIIPDSETRKKMLAGLKEVRDGLRGGEKSSLAPAERAANTIFALWRASQPRQTP
jgi:lipid-A-disaccharide synthase